MIVCRSAKDNCTTQW